MKHHDKGTTFATLIGSKNLPNLPGQGGPDVPFAPTPTPPVIEKLYSVSEVGRYLRIGVRPIYAAIKSGKLVASWIGRAHLVSESSIIAYVKLQQGVSSWHGKKPAPEAAKGSN